MDLTLEEANRRLEADGYPPIKRLPADEAAFASWKRIVDAKREMERDGEVSEATFLAVSAFCHCIKCPTYPRGDKPAVYCFTGKTDHEVKAIHCKCPTCAVYEVAALGPTKFYCLTGKPEEALVQQGGLAEAARKFLAHEIEQGNPGKRIPERLMAPPQFVGKTQDDFDVPEKVPGT